MEATCSLSEMYLIVYKIHTSVTDTVNGEFTKVPLE